MIHIVSDPSRKIKYYFRVNSTPIPKTFQFEDEDGNPYPVNTKTWQVNLKNNERDTTNVVQLTEGNGLVIGVNSITLQPTFSQFNIPPKEYYIEFRNVTDSQSWFTGKAIGHNGEFDNFESTSGVIVVSDTTQNSVLIDQSGATLTHDISSYDAFVRTAQAEPLTIANPTGSIGNFEGFQISLKSDGTARAFTMGNKFVPFGQAFKTEISATKTLVMTCIYNATNDTYMTATTEEV